MAESASSTVTLAVAGAAGRLGQRICAVAMDTDGVELVSAFEHPDHEAVGQPAVPGVADSPAINAGADSKADVIIDFTSPEVTRQLLDLCAQEEMGLVIGTTGLGEADHEAIDQAARSVPVVQAPNMSLGINLLLGLAGRVAAQLGDDYDKEILEAHHRYKKDAPSGTAKGLAEAICEATGKDPARDVLYSREGGDVKRQPGQITVQSLRMGDVVGEHTAFFGGLGERIELKHVASSRDTFARGAVRAAVWLSGKGPGRYDMKDVLGLR